MHTKVGKIAKMIIENESPETPIQRKLSEVGKILGIACLLICFLVFVIGVIKKIPAAEMFMTSIGLAVAAIPEGLPAIVTIMLSIGVTKMAKKNTIIRKLPAVETLGSSSIICSDKTGTLTQNKMQVVEEYNLNGKIENIEDKRFLLQLCSMCNSCEVTKGDVIGEPTEVALVNAALKIGENKNDLYKKYQKTNEIPFDSGRKLMTTIHRLENGSYRIITKGAPDILINRCDHIDKQKVGQYNANMADRALRVLAVAYKDIEHLPQKIDTSTIEQNLTFVGLIGMIDPPRVRRKRGYCYM